MTSQINILHDAVRELCPTAITVRGYDIDSASAYDANEKELSFNKTELTAKCAELEATKEAEKQAAEAAKQSGMAKLAAIGLTPDEIKSLLGV
jgi:hypothetical protein